MADNLPGHSIKERLRHSLSAAGKFKSLWQYLMFVALAGLFWLIMALNDDVQSDFTVRVEIAGVPDSVTFITDPPSTITVSVRDKGSLLLRRRFMSEPVIRIPFSEYASGNRLRISQSVLMSRLRSVFGSEAVISITSTDSIGIWYTSSPAKIVPIRADVDVTPALGKVINGAPRISVREAKLYAVNNMADTIMYVSTQQIMRRDLSDPLTVKIGIRHIPGVRIEPSDIEVTIPVEPLENRRDMVTIVPTGVPPGESMALFPHKVEVSYLVPMSMNEELPSDAFAVTAAYDDIAKSSSAMVRIKLTKVPAGVYNASLRTDSVEYTIIREAR